MLRRTLIYFLTTLIAVQSMMAMADAHQLHQSGLDHLNFNHDHVANNVDLQLSDGQPLDIINSAVGHDCHHCCHCHGMSPAFLAGPVHTISVDPAVSSVSFYPAKYASIYKTPDNPPPI